MALDETVERARLRGPSIRLRVAPAETFLLRLIISSVAHLPRPLRVPFRQRVRPSLENVATISDNQIEDRRGFVPSVLSPSPAENRVSRSI